MFIQLGDNTYDIEDEYIEKIRLILRVPPKISEIELICFTKILDRQEKVKELFEFIKRKVQNKESFLFEYKNLKLKGETVNTPEDTYVVKWNLNKSVNLLLEFIGEK